jgi:hypothetical protein
MTPACRINSLATEVSPIIVRAEYILKVSSIGICIVCGKRVKMLLGRNASHSAERVDAQSGETVGCVETLIVK